MTTHYGNNTDLDLEFIEQLQDEEEMLSVLVEKEGSRQCLRHETTALTPHSA